MSSDLTSDVSASFVANVNENVLNIIVNVVKKLFLFLIIYSLGYFEFSIVGPCIIFAFFLHHQKWQRERRYKRELARAMALGFEKEILRKVLTELPSWVNFPDLEKAEWLNKIFKLFWERINLYIHGLVPTILEPAVQSYVEDFRFGKVILGNVPLRIDAVKVYEQDSSNKVVLDVDISYAGDCYVTFQTFKFTGGIKDIQLYGRLRVVLTPIISRIPIIGGLQVYFMNEPRIDFELIKFTQILDVPVIRNKIKSTIMKIINSMFLFPNVYSIKLHEGVNLSKLTIFRSEGILRVHVVEARCLVNKDIIGKSDPYTVLSIGSVKIETHVIQNSLNPKWDYWTEFEAETNSELKIHVWDRDEGSKDESLGHARIDISTVAQKGQDDQWIKLQDVGQGIIHIRLTWLNLSAAYGDLGAAMKEAQMLSPHLHAAILMIYLESSQNLPKLWGSPPNCHVQLQVEGTIKVTDGTHKSCDPLWDKGFTFMLRDPKRAVLDVAILDDDTKVGDFSYKVDNMKNHPDMEFRNHEFFLNATSKKASITCSMNLRIFKNHNVEEEEEAPTEVQKSPRKVLRNQESNASTKSKNSEVSEETESCSENDTSANFSGDTDNNSRLGNVKLSLSYSEQRQKLVVVVHEVEKISYKTSSDFHLYVKLYLQTNKINNNKQKTKSQKHKPHLIYNESFEYLISSQDLTTTHLIVVVAAERRFIKPKFLGQMAIDLKTCADLSEPFTEWFNLKRKDDTNVYFLSNK